MGIPNRLYKLAQGYLSTARSRMDELDMAAVEELRRALPREDADFTLPSASSSDPMERAAAKINAARNVTPARRELDTPPIAQEVRPERYNFSVPLAESQPTKAYSTPSNPVATAYKILGIPLGSDYPTVEKAISKHRETLSLKNFADGSSEQAQAAEVLTHVEDAHQILRAHLGIADGRFDRLEL